MMHTLSDPNQNAMGNMPLEKAGIDIIVGKVVTFDPKAHTVTLESGQVLSYERLVLATGTEPIVTPIPGIEKGGVFTITKSMSAMTALREKVHQAKSVAIIGGGFIGAEFADELSHGAKADVHLIEIMPKCWSPPLTMNSVMKWQRCWDRKVSIPTAEIELSQLTAIAMSSP